MGEILARRVQTAAMCNCKPLRRGDTSQIIEGEEHSTDCEYVVWYNKYIKKGD
jgi:hypothetical protein